MKHIILPLVITIIALACGGTAPVQPTVDVGAIQTAAVQTSQALLPTQPVVIDTAQPTETTIPSLSTSGNYFAWNYIAKQESGGIQVEIARFVLADKTAVDQDFTAGGLTTIFDDRPVVGEILFKITNPTQQIISGYPDQGKVIGGGEQMDLLEFAIVAEFGDSFSGEIHPGVTVIGGIWFGFKRTPIDQITSVTIAFDAPHDQNFSSLGPEFNIVLDLTDRQNQPLPDELKEFIGGHF
jgi:hypothetical protein